MSDSELAKHLASLLGDVPAGSVLKGDLTSAQFAKSILGFDH